MNFRARAFARQMFSSVTSSMGTMGIAWESAIARELPQRLSRANQATVAADERQATERHARAESKTKQNQN